MYLLSRSVDPHRVSATHQSLYHCVQGRNSLERQHHAIEHGREEVNSRRLRYGAAQRDSLRGWSRGQGIGGAMPNLIALPAEAVGPWLKNTAESVMCCGMPFAGAMAALLGVLSTGDTAWRNISYAGGVGPLITIPALMPCLQSSAHSSERP